MEKNILNEIEELEVIESSELAIGNAFHAFNFKAVNEEDAIKSPSEVE